MAASAAVRVGQPRGSSAAMGSFSQRYRLGVALFLFAALFVAGGASRLDEPRQMVARLACLIAMAASAWRLERPLVTLPRSWRWFGLSVVLLLIAQLVPLPPRWWASLPGHRVYADIASATGTVGWRPLTLTPDLTLNSLFALLAPGSAIMVTLFLDTKARTTLWTWVVGAALVSAVLGLLQLSAEDAPLRFYRVTSIDSAVGIFANRNHQAAFLACALPLLGALLGTRLQKRPRLGLLAFGTVVIIVLMVGEIATTSRAGTLLGIAGVAGGLWTFRTSGGRIGGIKGHKPLLACAAVAVVLILIAVAASHEGVVSRFGDSDPASESRVKMIAPLLHTTGAFFPLGSGFGSFATVYRQFEPDALLSTIYMNEAHNEPLQLAIEGGLPALALLVTFLWWWGATAIALVRADLSQRRRPIANAAVLVSALLMAQSLVDYPLRTPLLAAMFALACFEMMRGSAHLAREPEKAR